jgi:hypothetical protein
MFSIEPISGKGLGIVATLNIKCGEVIVEDFALLMTVLTVPPLFSGQQPHKSEPANDVREVVPCENCLQPCRRITNTAATAAATVHLSTLPCIPCPACQSSYFCSTSCLHIAQQQASHLCPVQNIHMAALTADPLYMNAPRFRLFCQAVSRAAVGDKLLIPRLDCFVAPVMRTAIGQATSAIQNEFERQSAMPIAHLKAALGLDNRGNDKRITDVTTNERFADFVTPEGFSFFWRVCAANAQAVTQPAPFSTIMHDLLTGVAAPASAPPAAGGPFPSPSSSNCNNLSLVQEIVATLPPCVMQDCEGSALFPILSRFNHSCQPNVVLQALPSEAGRGVQVCACARRDIAQGEELCITYLGEGLEGGACACACEELLERYGFSCGCA